VNPGVGLTPTALVRSKELIREDLPVVNDSKWMGGDDGLSAVTIIDHD